ncbi:uncharacterized protein LOC113334019 [Papaver somniferum]|uniref:uncharacterized protein LOC113334019 n=1 Tax=Papaver somniferum TaxID=3469 RepID=UPI000E6F8D01|nr:uncharacterized protein LOC113334019 [Papaver somniferum]
MSDHWKTYRDRDVVEKASKIRECILSETWWDKVDYIVELTDPIVNMLRKCDTDDPTLHLVYEMWDSTIEKVRAIIFKHEEKIEDVDTSEFYNVVEIILFKRWTKNNTPLHCMAHSLNPKYYNDQWLQEGVGRVSPHQDEEISANREICLERLFPNVVLRQKIREEYGKFCARMGSFGRHDVMESGYSLNPLAWWAVNGSTTIMLQSLSAKLLSQPSSSSCCERNWSTYSNIHTLLRNRLTSERAESLVYVHSNLRLLSRQGEDYKVGPTRHWDALGENLNMEGPSALEDAVLSLDEPDLQPFNFDEEDATGED